MKPVADEHEKKTVTAFGEVLWDLLPSGAVLGGAPLNFAYRVHSLGDTALMVSRIGRDDLGRQAHEAVAELGLGTSQLQWDDESPTGTVQVSFDARNNPDYVIVPDVAYDRIALTEALARSVEGVDCLCFGTLAQRAPISRATLTVLLERAAGTLRLLDINLRKDCYDEDSVLFSLKEASVLKCNEDEVHALGEMLRIRHEPIATFCEAVVQRYALRYCLVTLGERGAFGLSDRDERAYVPGYRVDVADSLGAGDAFTAGFVHKVLRGAALTEAIAFGNVLGAIVATQTGATTPIAPGGIEAFLRQDVPQRFHPEFGKG